MTDSNTAEPGNSPLVIAPEPTGTARWWSLLATLSKSAKIVLPSTLQLTLNRQLWLHAGLAVAVPLTIALLFGSPLTAAAILLATFVVGGFIGCRGGYPDP